MQLGLRLQLLGGLALLLFVAGGIAAAVMTRLTGAEAEAQVTEQHRWRARALADGVAATCGAGMDGETCAVAITRLLATQVGGGALSAAQVVDADLRLLAGQPPDEVWRHPGVGDALQLGQTTFATLEPGDAIWPLSQPTFRVTTPTRLADGRAVALTALFDLSTTRAVLAERQQTVRWLLLADFVAVLLFGVYLSGRLVVDPLQALTEAAGRVGQEGAAGAGEATRAAQIPRLDQSRELARLSASFAEMVARLEAQHLTLRAHVEALERTRDELVRAEKLATVGRLAAGLAHEVGNPLAAVLGYLEFLGGEATPDPALQADLHQRMHEELTRIRATLRRLLDFSRPTVGVAAPASPRAVAESAWALVRYERRFQKTKVVIDGESPLALIDPEQLQQVVVNLLLNAADAMAGEGAIRVTATRSPEGAPRLVVADTGPGVPEADRSHLFEPYFTTKPVGEGTGLGLAICQRLLEAMGGQIALAAGDEPWAGSGATFVIDLPAVPGTPAVPGDA